MTTDAADWKEFISLSLQPLVQEISRLSAIVGEQNSTIRQIDIRSTTRVAELQKDINAIQDEIKEIKSEAKSLNDSQKFKWKTLSEERSAEREKQAKKDEEQAVINDGMKTVKTLLWTIITILLGIGIPFLWEVIKNGGLQGIVR